MDLSEKVAENLEKMFGVNGLRAGQVSQILAEEIRNRPAGVEFLTLGPKSDRKSRRIRWTWVGSEQVGQVGS